MATRKFGEAPGSLGSSLVRTFSKKAVLKRANTARSDDPLWGGQVTPREPCEPTLPSLEVSKARAHEKLARDPTTGKLVGDDEYGPRLADFEFLGLGVHSYVSTLHRMRFFFMLLALLSISSLVANGYGGELTEKQINAVTWAFTGASLGNANLVAPAYGATELVISTLMTLFLFWALAALDADVHRVEQKLVTPADFTVMVSDLPRDKTAAEVEAAMRETAEIGLGHPISLVVASHQRDLILAQRELTTFAAKIEAQTNDIDDLKAFSRNLEGDLAAERASAERLVKLKKARDDAQSKRQALLEATQAQVSAYGTRGPMCAGVAFVTFPTAQQAIDLLEGLVLSIPRLDSTPFPLHRPPEPSDVIWENLGCTDGFRRQIRGTIYMFLLSVSGAFLIGASAYLQPKATEANVSAGKGAAANLGVAVVGTLVLLAGYLVVFITVPIVEATFMRHQAVTHKEVSQVLKLVLFQVMATLSTIGSFVGDTAGVFNRDWYITGGFMLVNGMFVDLFVITCIIQGWGLVLNIGRLIVAPGALTQKEMDDAYFGDGANMYVVDRLQLVTKFVVMCYICSAAIPLLFFIVLLVLAISIAIDETNILRRLYPAPQTDESVVRCILVFVMPIAVLFHLLAARVFFAELRSPSSAAEGAAAAFQLSSALQAALPQLDFGSEAEDGLNLVAWSAWINVPIVLFFIVREWPRFWSRKTAVGPAAANLPKAMVGRAIAGSVWSPSAPRDAEQGGGHINEALGFSYAELESLYIKAGREAELRYAPPDTRPLFRLASGANP